LTCSVTGAVSVFVGADFFVGAGSVLVTGADSTFATLSSILIGCVT